MADLQRKTANLFDESTIQNGYYGSIGSLSTFTNDDRYRAFQMPIKAGTYTIKIQADEGIRLLRIATVNEFYNVQEDNRAYTFVISSDAIVYVSWRNLQTTNSFTNMTVMLNLGSTALPYEPYGWVHSLRKLGTETETIQSGDTIYANGQPISTYTIKGNTVQDGTPTPSNPVDVNGVGERTENLFDKDRTAGIIPNAYINQSGQQSSSQSYYLSYPIPVEPNQDYTWSFNTGFNALHSAPTVAFYDTNDTLLSVATHDNSIYWFKFTTPNDCAYIRASVYTGQGNDTSQLLLGSKSGTGRIELPFIPYGYKIPISSANTTTPVYLGEVESTRKIKKLVLSSSQNWQLQSINSHGIANFYVTLTNDFLNNTSVISNYFTRQTTTIADTTTEGVLIALSTNTVTVYIRINSQTASTAQEFKNWLDGLSEEVAIWYVLAEPTTGIVNEPIRKIGDYADTVSGITIPTITGADSFDVQTTLKPSEVELTYTGWHDASVKEYVGGGNLSPITAFANTTTDTRDFIRLMYYTSLNGTRHQEQQFADISTNGSKSYTLNVIKDNDTLVLRHNGSQANINIFIINGGVPQGTYTLSFDVEGHDCSTVGGLVLSNIEFKDSNGGHWE